MESIIILLLQARTLFHLKHLQTRNFNEHIILNELYESIVNGLDTLAEVYQGKNGNMNITNLPGISLNGDSVNHAIEIQKDLEDYRRSETNDQLNAILDEIINDFSSAIYKLRMH